MAAAVGCPRLRAVQLTLCCMQVNERYLPQLAALLSLPASVGIVGGRPGASLFFIGVQGRAVLFLDPHEVQTVSCIACARPCVAQQLLVHPRSVGACAAGVNRVRALPAACLLVRAGAGAAGGR